MMILKAQPFSVRNESSKIEIGSSRKWQTYGAMKGGEKRIGNQYWPLSCQL